MVHNAASVTFVFY